MRQFYCNITEKPEVAPKPTKRELFEKEKAFEFVVDVRGRPGEKLVSAEEVELEVSIAETDERLSEASEVLDASAVKQETLKVSTKEPEVEEVESKFKLSPHRMTENEEMLRLQCVEDLLELQYVDLTD